MKRIAWLRTIGAVIFAIAIAGLLAPSEMVATPNAQLRAARDALHIPIFFVITICFGLLTKKADRSWPILIPAVLATALAFGSEWIQPIFGRGAEQKDLIANLVGVGSGILWSVLFRIIPGKVWRTAWAVAAVGSFSPFAVPFASYHLDLRWYASQFPVVGSFDDPAILSFVFPAGTGSLSLEQPTEDGESTLRFNHPGTGSWSAIYLTFPAAAQDWRGFDSLHLAFHNPGEPVPILLRVEDAQTSGLKDRFQYFHTLPKGDGVLLVQLADIQQGPDARLLDLSEIRKLTFSIGKQSLSCDIYVRRIWLE